MEEQKDIKKNIMTQHPPWLRNNITYSYKEEYASNNVRKKQHFLQHKVKLKKGKEIYTDESKNIGKNTDFAAVFTDITKREFFPEKAIFHAAEITAIKIIVK